MNSKICTSIEQSKKLLELGVNIHTADMFYPNRVGGIGNYALSIEWKKGLPLLSQEIPAWSLSGLLELMPKELENDLELYYGAFGSDGEYYPLWVCSCMNYVLFGNTLVDAVFKALCWLKENGKI